MSPTLMHLPTQTNPESKRLATVYDLPDLAVFDVTGPDAVSFLQGQITNDIAGATRDTARLAGYCTAQGRLLATMVLMHATSPDNVPVLSCIIKRDLLEPVLKRLSMFVMRAKAKLTEKQHLVRGFCLDQGELAEFESMIGSRLPSAVWGKVDTAAGSFIAAPSTGNHRWWLVSDTNQREAAESLSAQCSTGKLQDWHALDISEGLPWIESATQDLFIPQTLNLDLIGGVSFTKGCYPGQEIVARSHYRGTLKRRMIGAILAKTDEKVVSRSPLQTESCALVPGADIYDASLTDHICGRIINVAITDRKSHLLIEASFEAVDHAQLHAMAANGPALVVQPLPYSVRPVATER